jgi:hypothetical protein
MIKTHVGFCLDESGSVAGIVNTLTDAYNKNVDGIRESVLAQGQEATMTAVSFGHRWLKHRTLYVGQQVQTVKPLNHGDLYPSGMTPLFDSVYNIIKILEELDDGKPDTSFIITVVTDGYENNSIAYGVKETLSLMEQKISTDRWTFTFLVPNGNAVQFSAKYGVPRGNIQEWDTKTDVGTEKAFAVNTTAYDSYFVARTAGTRSTKSFYSDIEELTVRKVRKDLSKITNQVTFIRVPTDCTIREAILGAGLEFIKGAAFYQLVKREKRVQDYKLVALRVKTSGEVYCGTQARDMLGIGGITGTISLNPGDHGKFDVFIQSTSYNRKIPANTEVLYWPKVGTQKK